MAVVPVDGRGVEALGESHWASFSNFSHQERPTSDLIGAGDILAVQIYEPGSGGLFGAGATGVAAGAAGMPGASGVSSGVFPRLPVDRDGSITVPFAGKVAAAGKTPEQVQELIEGQLRGKAISPQAVVSVVLNLANTAIIDGDVRSSGRFPLTLAGERVRDIIDLAGGAAHEPQDTFVQLSRGEETARVLLQRVIDDRRENIFVYPGDQISLIHKARTVIVVGATGQPSEVPLVQTHVNLVQVLARAGWLRDDRANPAAVYLFRFELPDVAQKLDARVRPVMPNGFVPIIYRINFANPKEFFVAQSVEVRDGDVVYVPNAGIADAAKLAGLFQQFTGIVYDVSAFAYFGRLK